MCSYNRKLRGKTEFRPNETISYLGGVLWTFDANVRSGVVSDSKNSDEFKLKK